MKKYFILFLLIWITVTTFLAYESPRVQYVISFFKKSRETNKRLDIKKEHQAVVEFVLDYYEFKKDSDPDNIYAKVRRKVLKEKEKDILEGYKKNLNFFKDKEGQRSIKLEKILRDKITGEYKIYASMKQKIMNSKNYPYIIEITVELTPVALNDGDFHISNLVEKILISPNENILDRTIYVDKGVLSITSFPCVSNSLQSVENKEGVEFRVLPNGKSVEFNPIKDLKTSSRFKTVCGRRSFEINLASSENYTTLFQRFDLEDGILKRRKLTQQEQLVKDIEEQFGGEVIN